MTGEGFDLEPWFFYGNPPSHEADFNYNIPSGKIDAVMDALQKIEGVPDVEQTGVLKRRIVKLSATILNDKPQMVFCSPDIFVVVG